MKFQNVSLQRGLLAAFLLAACITTAKAQPLYVDEIRRSAAQAMVVEAADLPFGGTGASSEDDNSTDGDFSTSQAITSPSSAFVSCHQTASQLSSIIASPNSLHITGQLEVTTAYSGTAGTGQDDWGAASFNSYSTFTCLFRIECPFVYTLVATNSYTSDGGVADYGAIVFMRNESLGGVVAAFGESTAYPGVAGPASGTASGVLLSAGQYKVYSSVADGSVMTYSHSGNRRTSFTLDLSPAVTLSIQPTNGGVILSWPAAASSYALRATGTSTGGTWVPVTNAPVQVGDDLQVVLQPATGTRFFRLERSFAQ